jgi:cytochrome oxidase assembly protein ShyY1
VRDNLPRVYRLLLTPRWLGWLALALAAAMVMTLLGFWQLHRYEERSEINNRIDAADVADPAPLSRLLSAPAPDQQVGPAAPGDAGWAMVDATGHFDEAHEVLVRGRTVEGRVGFEVVTPLVLPDGTAVLVNRGWVPPSADGAAARPEVPAAPPGEVTVVGRVRFSESGPRPVEEHAGALQTRRINLDALAPHVPYPLYGAYLQLESPAQDGLTPIPVRRENAWLNGGYAVQWWIFAGMVLAGYVWFVRREARGALRQPAAPARPATDNRAESVERGGGT